MKTAEVKGGVEQRPSFQIICPEWMLNPDTGEMKECGKQVAMNGRCPRCGGNSWVPAGNAGGITLKIRLKKDEERRHDFEEKEEAFRISQRAADAGRDDRGEGAEVLQWTPQVKPRVERRASSNT